ncbi:DUF1120 domain-containing protein [Leclercia adecarboxylata]|uniref:DUF1120 domain-containing protein n=1 Tax=Leclercia TaxID=83654 RepID=UPI000CCFE869|nr:MULTISPECIES: DUF1120 domain-containing protein [Leclercia]POV34925.1 hypothetical protein C3388_10225 [Leclercia sp. LSNIH5]POW64371.1 hypothetical protein C3389_17360 [Leclercia sp. LSNIH2]AUU82902.1 hypothetical protein C2U54_02200 [Leclercia sp. LSNIH1]MCZ7837459.1 DUF1120 domain-containing protein [Leclercia adecarboxylata]MEB5751754.1 DUF1120 domain-containing protein [Leclercia adecarboxylata]
MTLFKKNVATLAVGAALLVSAQVNAADDVTMKVSGTILPAACTPALSNSGEVAFGSIAASSIRKAPAGNALVQLGSKDITLTVTCDAATAIGFTMADNRASSAANLSSSAYINSAFTGGMKVTEPYFAFGLGVATNDAKIGAYSVAVDGAKLTADSVAANMLVSDDQGATWRTASYGQQSNDNSRIVTAGEVGSLEPKMFKEMTVPLKIAAGVQPSSVLGSDEIVLNGSATLSLVYL